ncbi:MAG: glycosyltransferase family 4 protein [Caldilineaceae bacterium]
MRILQIVQKPQRRGAEIFALQQSKAMRTQGHTVGTIYLYPYRGEKTIPLQPNDWILDGKETHWQEKLPGINLKLLSQLQKKIMTFAPDIVQVNGARTIKYGAFVKKYNRPQWKLIYRNIDNPTYWVNSQFHLWFYKHLVMPQIDGIVGVSETTLERVKTLYHTTAPAQYIPNGIDLSRLQPVGTTEEARHKLGQAADAKIVLFMGSLTTQKRPDRFLRIVHQLHGDFSNIQGWFLGDGPQRCELERQVAALQLENHIRFWGYQEEITSYIAAADLLLVTSDSDGIPAVVLEAGFLGKPTVGTKVGGMAECVLDGETGFLIDPQDEMGFAEAVTALLHNAPHCEAMGTQAKAWVVKNFAMAQVAQQYLDFYQQLIAIGL